MSVRFPYDKLGKHTFGIIYQPVALASFQSPKTLYWRDIVMVVDTGADFSIVPRHMADSLKISLSDDCVPYSTSGVGGDKKIYLLKKKINAKIGSLERNVPLAFFDDNSVPPILGRLGFLETFDVSFLKSHTVVFNS